MDEVSKDILIKLLECILQSRVDVQKKQIRRFDEVNKEIQKNKNKAYGSSMKKFLEQLLISEKYSIRQRMQKASHF